MNKVDTHRQYVQNAPAFIKDVFTSDNDICTGCSLVDGTCKYKYTKTYTIDGQLIHKCDAKAFTFPKPSLTYLSDYMDLLSEFYLKKVGKH